MAITDTNGIKSVFGRIQELADQGELTRDALMENKANVEEMGGFLQTGNINQNGATEVTVSTGLGWQGYGHFIIV